MPDLTEALTAACEFAREHGVPGDFTPADFGLQRSAPGYTHATHVTPTHLIAVTVSEDEGVCVGVGRIEWVHFPLDAGCGECAPAAPAAAPYGDLFPSTRLGDSHAERYARTVAELHALPARAVVGDRMGWLAVLTDELLDDARCAHVCRMEGERVLWEHHFPLEVLHLPGEPAEVLHSLAAVDEHYAALLRQQFPDIGWPDLVQSGGHHELRSRPRGGHFRVPGGATLTHLDS